MFSFRTTALEDQMDKALRDGKVGCFCTRNCWDTLRGRYMWEIFRERGNLVRMFTPGGSELGADVTRFDFSQEDLSGLDAVVVEIQDTGCRNFAYTRDVCRLLLFRSRLEEGPSIYIVDHINPAGRVVEGSMPAIEADLWVPKVALRHGLTLGELCSLYYHEIGATFPLHIISALGSGTNRQLMPWTIPPSPDVTGMFTCMMYSGGSLWNDTTITPGIGTARPYEYLGAPFILDEPVSAVPAPEGVMMRPCKFTPSYGKYAGELCRGYQIILQGGVEYHSLLHTLRLMRHFRERYSEFEFGEDFWRRLGDPVMEEYLKGGITFDIVEEHVKAEEQKWIRKAKRFTLYDDAPYRMK